MTGWCSLGPDAPLQVWFVVILGHVLALPGFFSEVGGREASENRVSFCAPEGIIIQWDSECATAEREIEH